MNNAFLEQVKKLRDITGVGLQDCAQTLKNCSQDFDKSLSQLRIKSLEIAESKKTRKAQTGAVVSYIHAGSKVGVLLELCCETDFVSRLDEFKAVAISIAQHMTFSSIPPSQIFTSNDDTNVNGFSMKILESEPFFSNPTITLYEYICYNISRFGENILIKNIVKFVSN